MVHYFDNGFCCFTDIGEVDCCDCCREDWSQSDCHFVMVRELDTIRVEEGSEARALTFGDDA